MPRRAPRAATRGTCRAGGAGGICRVAVSAAAAVAPGPAAPGPGAGGPRSRALARRALAVGSRNGPRVGRSRGASLSAQPTE